VELCTVAGFEGYLAHNRTILYQFNVLVWYAICAYYKVEDLAEVSLVVLNIPCNLKKKCKIIL